MSERRIMNIKIDTTKRYKVLKGDRGYGKTVFFSHRIYLTGKYRKWVYENGYDKLGLDPAHMFVVFLMHNGYLNTRKIIKDYCKDVDTLKQ